MTNRSALRTLGLAVAVLATLFSLSFIATPVKFLAADVPMSHLLAVGRETFRASVAIDSILLFALFVSARGTSRRLIIVAIATVVLQWIVIMPELDDRTMAQIAGAAVGPTSLHDWWIGLDVMRLAIYAFVVHTCSRHLRKTVRTNGLES